MKRFAAIVLFAAAVILSTHVLAPAAPPPARPAVSAADLALVDQAAPMIDLVNTQVDRLRERLAAPPVYPAPTRDPFRFGTREAPSRPKPAAPVASAVELFVPPPPVLPRLVAIAATAGEGGVVRTAVLTVGDDVQILKSGDSVLKFVIKSIGADVVELVDSATGATFRLLLH
jgi:hypothetical protein